MIIVVMLLMIPIQVHADHASVITDQTSYNQGDIIRVSGIISEYGSFPMTAEIAIYDPTGNKILDKKFQTDDHGKIDAYIETKNWSLSGTYQLLCTNAANSIFFSFQANPQVNDFRQSNHVVTNQVVANSNSTHPTTPVMLHLSERALINLYTKLDIMKNNGLIVNDDIVKVTDYLTSHGVDQNTLLQVILKVSTSSEVVRNTPTFTTEMHSCTHISYSPTVYMEGLITNNANSPHTVIFKFEVLDKNNNVLAFTESEKHQMGEKSEWVASDYVGYDPMFDHCDIKIEQIS